MAKTTSIKLGDHFDTFIASQLESGSYKNASELIREGLRKVEEEHKQKAVLRKILDKGMQDIEEGRVVENFSYESLMKKIDERIESRKK